MKCPGLHCDGCRTGTGGLVALVAVVIICAIIARPVARGVSDMLRVLGEILRVILTVAEIAGMAVAAGAIIAAAVVITGRTRRRAAIRSAENRVTEREIVDAILHREQLAPRVWSATVVPDEQPRIPATKEH